MRAWTGEGGSREDSDRSMFRSSSGAGMPRFNGVVVKVRYEALGWRACWGRRPQHLGHRREGLNGRPPGSFDAILRREMNSML